MTGISDLIAQKEQQARDDECKAIVEWLRRFKGWRANNIAQGIERGEHRRANNDKQV